MIISYYSKKGGVGTSTLATYNAHYLAKKGMKVLYISLCEQASVYSLLGYYSITTDKDSRHLELLLEEFNKTTNDLDRNNLIRQYMRTIRDNVDVIHVKNILEVGSLVILEDNYEVNLSNLIEYLDGIYDYVIVDYPIIINDAVIEFLNRSSVIIYVSGISALEEHSLLNFTQVLVNNDYNFRDNIFVLPNSWDLKDDLKLNNINKLKQDILSYSQLYDNVTILNPLEIFEKLYDLQQIGVSIYDDNVYNVFSDDIQELKNIIYSFNNVYKKVDIFANSYLELRKLID
ncbi:ParA family protein [Mycoplasmatota bacterium WC44]